MIQTIQQACRFNPIIFDYRMSEGIENLADLISDQGDGRAFFARNVVTGGMKQLFREGLLRLCGQSDQAVFELSQAMGGGKTHMMIALGLLARHPHLRREVLPAELWEHLDERPARLAAFNGRNNPDHFIWGEIACQLDAKEAIRPFWAHGPRPVDQATWKAIIGDAPTLILLDELPPYLDQATTQRYGDGTLATMVVYSLSCLMAAALELPRCCVVLANLSGTYHAQTRELHRAIDNLQNETRRQAMTITPVELASNEVYDILKKRLIDELPDEATIGAIADAYAQQVHRAEEGGTITQASIQQLAEEIRRTYPFHPSFKHLVALFRENEGFRQTRGLMQFTARLLKSVDKRPTDDVLLIGAQHLNLNDQQARDEIDRIAPQLGNAIAHDIADKGNAIAEGIDLELSAPGQPPDGARQVMTLLLTASLSRAMGGRMGLTESELVEFLITPHHKAECFTNALERLREQAWYLHREEQRYYIKETENLSRQIERNARDIPQARIDDAFIKRLEGLLQPRRKLAYQAVQVLPQLSEIDLRQGRVLLVVKPDGKTPPSELQRFFDQQTEKNNVLVLSGEDSARAEAVEYRLRELYAIEQITARLKPGDTLYEEATRRQEEIKERFHQALGAGYNRLYYPAQDPQTNTATLAAITLEQGMWLGHNEQSAETQLEKLLASPRADYKLVPELKPDNMTEYFAMAESMLWPQGQDNRRTPWRDVVENARCKTSWPWLPGARGLEDLKTEALKQGRWRLGEDGYIEKGPFPKDKATVNVTVLGEDPAAGTITLCLTPRHAGTSPIIHYATTRAVNPQDPKVDNPEHFTTQAATLYFLVIDTTAQHDSAPPLRWLADIKIRHQVETIGTARTVRLEATPRAELRYSLDGTNPADGRPYEGPIPIDSGSYLLQVEARAGEAVSRQKFTIAESNQKTAQVDPARPARLQGKKVELDSTEKVFGLVNTFRDKPATCFKGVRIEFGSGERTVSVNFLQREVNAPMIEAVVNSLRDALKDAQSPISVKITEARFASGHDLIDFATIAKVELKPDEVIQES
jgi:hypothetical protein